LYEENISLNTWGWTSSNAEQKTGKYQAGNPGKGPQICHLSDM